MRRISAIFSFIYKERNKEKKKDVVVINVAWNDNDNVPAFRLVLATVPVERLSGTLEGRFALETRRVCRENAPRLQGKRLVFVHQMRGNSRTNLTGFACKAVAVSFCCSFVSSTFMIKGDFYAPFSYESIEKYLFFLQTACIL